MTCRDVTQRTARCASAWLGQPIHNELERPLPSNPRPRIETHSHWLGAGLMAVLLLGGAVAAQDALEAPFEPSEKTEALMVGRNTGTRSTTLRELGLVDLIAFCRAAPDSGCTCSIESIESGLSEIEFTQQLNLRRRAGSISSGEETELTARARSRCSEASVARSGAQPADREGRRITAVAAGALP